MFDSLMKAFRQSFDPAFRRVFWHSFAYSVATFVVVWLLAWLLLGWLNGLLGDWLTTVELWGWVEEALLWLAGAGGVAVVAVASFLLFPGVMLVAMSFLLEEIAQAVEGRHYPALGPARSPPLRETLVGSVAFVGISLVLNLLVLLFFWWLYLIPPFNLILFYSLNGYLLGREYFELVAQRRLPLKEVKTVRRSSRGQVFLAGVVIAFLLTIPLVNLVTPMVATAFMLHVFERVRARA